MKLRWDNLRSKNTFTTHGFRHLFVCALVLASVLGCNTHGSKITFKVKEDRVLPIDEFEILFAETNLNSECYWYFGNKNGYAYVEIDESRSIDEYDDYLNRRVHHTLRRYRVAEADVEFIPKMDFTGYDRGKRIVEFRNAGGDWSAVYRIIRPTTGGTVGR